MKLLRYYKVIFSKFEKNLICSSDFKCIRYYSKRKLELYGWGYTKTGALGSDWLETKRKSQLIPIKLSGFSDLQIERVASGYGNTCVVGKRNKDNRQVLKVAGLNTYCQLGFPNLSKRRTLTEVFIVPENEHIKDVSLGRTHTLVATDAKTVYCLGNNSNGQCGRSIIEDEIYSENPVINPVRFESEIKQVECGQDYSLVLLQDGRVFACGLSSDGQTSQNHYDNVQTFKEVMGDVKGEKIVQVSSKADTVLAVSDKNDMFGWGNNEYDQLRTICKDEQQVSVSRYMRGGVKKVAAAGSMCALIDDSNVVHTWGYGLLGRGPAVDRCETPTPLPSVLFHPFNKNEKNLIKDIKCGLHHFAVLTEHGEMYTWGKNRLACLGLGHKLDQYIPFKVHISAEVTQVSCGVDHGVVLCRSYI